MASSIVSTAAPESSPLLPVISHEDLLFDYPDADVILRSLDSHDFRVLKMYIVHSSPVLREKISISPTPQPEPTPPIPAEPAVEGAAAAANTLCVVQLPVEGAILFSLLTHIFPVPPVLPSTVEQVMELLSVAQQYKMDVVLTHIRNHIARREPPLIRRETSPVVYFLSLKYGLHPEALQAARCTLSLGTLTFGGLAKGDVLDKMPGAFLHELWKYHLRVRSNLSLDLKEFEMSGVPTILGESSCVSLTDSSIPSWLKNYLSTIGTGRRPATIDLADFHMSLAKHTRTVNSQAVKRGSMGGCASCSGLRRKSIRELWEALTAVVRGSISKVRAIHGAASPKGPEHLHRPSWISHFLSREHVLKVQLVKPLLHRNIRICSMRMSSSNHPTMSISASINRCWLRHRHFLGTCSPSPNRQMAQHPTSFPWCMYQRMR